MKKIVTSIMIVLVSVLCMAGYTYAAGQLGATIVITPNVTQVKAGDKVTFTFTTKDIVNAESGKIYAIEGVIEYDKNFFTYDSGLEIGATGKFNSMTAVSEGGKNGEITLKVIDNPTGTGIVKFTELSAGDGRLEDSETLGTAKTPDQTITITLKTEETPPAGNEGTEDVTPPAVENKPTTEGTTVVVGGDKDNTVADREIPKAGLSTILGLGVIAIIVIAIVIYNKNQKYQDIK